ncbi:MAG: hypothetical protein H0U86_06235 [Chloroflexi bacterium]|nr:hypothetical protein [Chloroflexota bacterium]
MMRLLRDQGLAIAMFGIFAVTLGGLMLTGWSNYNEEQAEHGETAVALDEYLGTPAFGEAVFENWESEFLQMGAYVLLTAFLFSRGSSESKNPDGDNPADADPRQADKRGNVPWPVRTGGIALALYENSLTIALFALFIASFALHAATGAGAYSQEQIAHGGQAVSVVGYLATSRFWFESFQNWQSEFLAVGTLIVFSIFLRQRGSPESKPVAASHAETGA